MPFPDDHRAAHLRTPVVGAAATLVAALVAWVVAGDAPGAVGVVALVAVVAAGVAAVLASASAARADHAREREAFLGEASTMLLACPDRGAAATTSAALAVPQLADWCAIDVVEEDGATRRRAVRGTDVALADPAALDDGAVLSLPLRTVEREVGVMTLVTLAPAGFEEETIDLAADLTRRCAAAIANTPSPQDAAAASGRFRRGTPSPRAATEDEGEPEP